MPDARRLLIDVALILGVGMLLALLGPFGSFAAPFAIRLLFWLALPLAGYFLYMPATVIALRLSERLDLPAPALWVAACLSASVPMALVIWGSGALFGGVEPLTLAGYMGRLGQALAIGGPIMLLFWWLRRDRPVVAPLLPAEASEPPLSASPASPRTRFLDRLPPHLGTDILALQMEDHYVRVHTPRGSTLILMRMRDAALELDGVEGLQVHRSWWVARAALASARREGREARLTLTNGIDVPVSRAQVPVLRAAGWL